MALNFPDSPTLNQEVELGGKTYRWDGVKWRMVYVVTPTAQAVAPIITEISKTSSSITFTITNNDANTADILWEMGDATPDENIISLESNTTSSNITINQLSGLTTYTIYAYASVPQKIQSQLVSLAIQTNIAYTEATGGTILEYDSGGKRYRSHTFLENGTFSVTIAGNGELSNVDYLIVAGGGGSSNAGFVGGGGGGAGGFLTTFGTSGRNSAARPKVAVSNNTDYPVVIGAGGTYAQGSNSTVFNQTAIGGGRGASGYANVASTSGGSGGGGWDGAWSPGTFDQGFDGRGGEGNAWSGGGGGGAGQNGETALPTDSATSGVGGGDGGDGLPNQLRTGSDIYYAGGGAGGQYTGEPNRKGGLGGGGLNGNGGVNTGGGGGGRYSNQGSSGGSGIVVIRYEIAPSV